MLKQLIFKGLDATKNGINYLYTWSGLGLTYSDGSNTSSQRNKNNAVRAASIMEELPRWSRWEEVKYCRYLTKNHNIPQAVFSDIITYTIGGGAIAEFHGGTPEWQKQQEDDFSAWSRRASAYGRDSLVDLVKIALQAVLRDGEVFIVYTYDDEGRPILQVCETHIFRDNLIVGRPNEFIDGIRYSESGEALEYLTINGEKIPGSAVLHLCDPKRSGELRCGPMWASEINPLFDSKELALLAGTGFKNQLFIPVIIDRPGGGGGNPLVGKRDTVASAAVDNGATQRFEETTGVRIYENKTPGGGVHMSKPEYPGALYAGFQETYARSFCSTIYAWPFDFTNLTNKTGTTQRTVLEKATRISENIQRNKLDIMLKRAAVHWLAWRVKTQQIKAVDSWWKVSFRYPRAATIDMGRDTTSDALEISKGMQSIPEYFARYQQDWRVEFQKNADALGITFDEYRRVWVLQNFGPEAFAKMFPPKNPTDLLNANNLQ